MVNWPEMEVFSSDSEWTFYFEHFVHECKSGLDWYIDRGRVELWCDTTVQALPHSAEIVFQELFIDTQKEFRIDYENKQKTVWFFLLKMIFH